MKWPISPAWTYRVFMTIGAVAILGATYGFLNSIASSVEVTEPMSLQRSVKFDAKLDVTQHPLFPNLKPLASDQVVMGTPGRDNPFVPYATTTQE